MPGDPVENMLGEKVTLIPPEDRAALEVKFGLDRPIQDQYLSYLSSVITWDLGYSITRSAPVLDLIAQRLVVTLAILLPAIIIGSAFALVLATRCGMHRGGKVDAVLSSLAIFIQTVPGFLIAMVFVLVFSFTLGWFPLGHFKSGDYQGVSDIADILYHISLPIFVLALLGGSSKFLVLRNSITQINGDYFIFVARSKGLSERVVAHRHVMRNVLPTFMSLLALNLGFMVGGALLIELVFSINGMGTLIYDAVMTRDYPMLQGCFIVLTLVVLLASFLAEVLYGLADPRIGDSKDQGVNL
jgi:peptide/nickel transport system permease protein